MFQTAAGVTVPFPEKLSEQYELDGNTITANLSFEKLSDFVHSFYAELDEPLFLAIHPDAESDEVWYLDGMTKKQLRKLMICEGVLYAVLAGMMGLFISAILSMTLVKGITAGIWYMKYHFTLVPALVVFGRDENSLLFCAVMTDEPFYLWH